MENTVIGQARVVDPRDRAGGPRGISLPRVRSRSARSMRTCSDSRPASSTTRSSARGPGPKVRMISHARLYSVAEIAEGLVKDDAVIGRARAT